MKRLAAGLLPLCIASMAVAQQWVSAPARPGAPVRDPALLRDIMLAGHNEARGAAGVGPLQWDAQLAVDAETYAREMAETDRFQHSTGRRGKEPQGENLWVGTRLDYSYAEMVALWVDERRAFKPGIVPDVSVTGDFAHVAHYVHIIWPTTRRFGCAVAGNDRLEYLVCRYAPPGNMAGRRLG